jgi:hypothetical protein
MKEGVVMGYLLARLGGEIMRYFSGLAHDTGRNDRPWAGKPASSLRNRALAKTLLGTAHSAKVDTGFA